MVGYWTLQGDCRDYSGHNNHGANHGVKLDGGAGQGGSFDGVAASIEVPSHPSLKLGAGDFAICARIRTEQEPNDVLGDVLEMYDPVVRRGITFSLKSSAGGYQSQGADRHVCFGIDNGRLFASIGNCTSSAQDAPCDVRGKVYSLEAGRIADVRVYNRALTDAEIAKLASK